MKKGRKILVVLLAILIPVSIGFGYKFFSWKGNKSLSNQAMTVDGDISIENIPSANTLLPGDKICDEIQFNIKSTATSLLRVKIDGFVSSTSDGNKDKKELCKIEGLDENWIDGQDGYYYYIKGVSNTTNSTVPFVTGIYFEVPGSEDANNYQGKYIGADIQAEMVQAKHGVFKDHWNIGESSNVYSILNEISQNEGE